MIIKTPVCLDVSHWKTIPNFQLINPRPFLMITKATEGVSFVDSSFVRFFLGMKEAGYKRGAYHFFRRQYDGAGQARHFLNVVSSYITDDDLLILDVEEGGETAAQLQAWFTTVHQSRPRNRLLIYSRRNILEAILMTTAQKEYFKGIPVWVAGYPANPDMYDAVPNFYIPDPTRWGAVALWQYSSSGTVGGIVGDVDLNWIAPFYVQILGNVPQPPTEETGMYKLTALVDINIRSGPGTSYPITIPAGVRTGDVVESTTRQQVADGSWWYKIDRLLRANVAQPLPANPWASAGANGGYMRLEPEPPASVYPVSAEVTMSDGSKWTGNFTRA